MPQPTLLVPSLVLEPSPVALFTASQAPMRRPRLRDAKAFVRVRHGVYATAAEWAPLAPWERYLARVHAFGLLHPGAVFALESAAALRGLPIFGEPHDIHVHDEGRTSSRRFGDVCVHTSEDSRDIEIGMLAVTSLADTVVDLMRVLPPAFGLAVADAAISEKRGGTASVQTLTELAGSQVNRRGRARIEWVLDHADARAESPGETVSRAVIDWCGFEEPVLQQEFELEGFHDRTDFGWPRLRIAGESDGYGKYRAETAEETVERVVQEKKREDRLRRALSGFARWDLADALAVRVRDKLLSAGLPQVRPEQAVMLATLRNNPRSLPSAGRAAARRRDGMAEKP